VLILATTRTTSSFMRFFLDLFSKFVPTSLSRGITPLHVSSAEGHLGICEFLVEHKADVNAKTEQYDKLPYLRKQYQPLAFSCCLCFVSFIFSLSSRDATPLIFAAEGGNLDICQFLVEHKADINAQNDMYDSRPERMHLKTRV
jgi:ankyrin repeat protein